MADAEKLGYGGGAGIEAQECSMCGDVGFESELFRCKKCVHRLQHTYCSKSYPEMGSNRWICDWCLFEEENAGKNSKSKRKGYGEETDLHYSNALELLLEVAKKASSDSSCKKNAQDPPPPSPQARVQVPKRQRCGLNEKNRLDLAKWGQLGKNKMHLPSPSKSIGGRRYKLLSDVLC